MLGTNKSKSLTIEQRVELAKLSIAAKTARDKCIEKFDNFTATSSGTLGRVEDAQKAQLELSKAPGADKVEVELANAWNFMLEKYSINDWQANTRNMNQVKAQVMAADTRHESYIKAAPVLLMLPPDKRDEIARKSVEAKKARDAFYAKLEEVNSNVQLTNKARCKQLTPFATAAYEAQSALAYAVPNGTHETIIEGSLGDYFNGVYLDTLNSRYSELLDFVATKMRPAEAAADARHLVYTGNFANATELLNAAAAAEALDKVARNTATVAPKAKTVAPKAKTVAPKAKTVAPKKWSVCGVLGTIFKTGCTLISTWMVEVAVEYLSKVSLGLTSGLFGFLQANSQEYYDYYGMRASTALHSMSDWSISPSREAGRTALAATIFVVGASTLAYKYFCCPRNNEVEVSRF